MPFLFCSKTSISHHDNFLPAEGPSVWCVVLGTTAVWGRVDARDFSGAKSLRQIFSTLVNHRLLKKKRVEGWRWRNPVIVVSMQHPYPWEKAEEAVWEKQSKILGALWYESERKLCFLTESHLLALWHSGSLKLSLNETWLNKTHVLYLKKTLWRSVFTSETHWTFITSHTLISGTVV